MQNESYNQMGNVNSNALALGLMRAAGSIYIAFGLLELSNYFYHEPIDLFGVLVYMLVGVGLFQGYAWSRILCITVSGIALGAGVLLFVFRSNATLNITLNGSPLVSAAVFVLGTMIVHSLLLYILLRRDVTGLLSARGKYRVLR